MRSMLYIVYGIGRDAVGLVGGITAPIAEVGGNIVDMRQDVLHGLFTIYMVVDLKQASASPEEFETLLGRIGEETGVRLSIEKYSPVARSAEKTNILLTLVGRDKPGIIAAISEKLGTYNINIEISEMVAREGVFLMDLLCDVGRSSVPMENLKGVVREIMASMDISTMFQTEDVFNKKKKIVLFDLSQSFMAPETLREVLNLSGIDGSRIARAAGREDDLSYMHTTAGYLDGLPLNVVDAVADSTQVSPGTMELLQTLKIMGYKIGLLSTGFTFFLEPIRRKLDIDYAFGFELPVDDDSKTLVGDIAPGVLSPLKLSAIIENLAATEKVEREDITIISDRGRDDPRTPGIRLDFNMKVILDFHNQHILSRDALTGLLRSFGIPRL
ncbi:MAG TPA: ACT domain-containing protein [Deltaproteobacteria bacterium]|nr:ACT domain-containing protein [Deltaproteobacteria bacterium]HQM21396.1 ACT domain-containing protein [Deltaproteobacteria bacterium]